MNENQVTDVNGFLDYVSRLKICVTYSIKVLGEIAKPLGDVDPSLTDKEILDLLHHINLGMKVEAKAAIDSIAKMLSKGEI